MNDDIKDIAEAAGSIVVNAAVDRFRFYLTLFTIVPLICFLVSTFVFLIHPTEDNLIIRECVVVSVEAYNTNGRSSAVPKWSLEAKPIEGRSQAIKGIYAAEEEPCVGDVIYLPTYRYLPNVIAIIELDVVTKWVSTFISMFCSFITAIPLVSYFVIKRHEKVRYRDNDDGSIDNIKS